MFERLPLHPPITPMEARAAAAIPQGAQWLYEPKWDGFRCIAFRDGQDVALQSKNGQPLERYFPEIVETLAALRPSEFILDGELVIERAGALDFDALLQRIHPASSRVARLAMEAPAAYPVFDLLSEPKARIFELPLAKRRERLEAFASAAFSKGGCVALSPSTQDFAGACAWLAGGVAWFDGVLAKRTDASYRFGERDAAVKVKRTYTADCVVGGFRLAKDSKTVASLLLGLYDSDGLLHLVGFVGSMNAAERERAAEKLLPIVQEPGFTGARPGGASRWGSRDAQWHPVAARVVVEVQFDRVTGRRFRHGARFVRWRPDKDPGQCTMDQAFSP